MEPRQRDPIHGLGIEALVAYGLTGLTSLTGKSIQGVLVYERPTFVFNPRRIKSSTLGAFSYINGNGSSAMYRCKIGRYCSIGEDVVIGPPEHPVDLLSTHPFTFARPDHLPGFYAVPEFAKLAPDATAAELPLPPWTELGHDVWVGAGGFVKRGVRVGHGAIVAAHAVVTRDVPPYAIVTGTPAKVMRLRFSDAIVERLLKLEWWNYDLAPHKQALDFSNVERVVEDISQLRDDGKLLPLNPETYRVTREDNAFSVERLPTPLY